MFRTILFLLFVFYTNVTRCIPLSETSKVSLVTVVQQKFQAEKARNAVLTKRLIAFQKAQQLSLTPHIATKSLLKRLNTIVLMLETESNNLELTLKLTQLEIDSIQSRIQNLQRYNVGIRAHVPVSSEIEEVLSEQYRVLEIHQKRIRVLQKNYELLYKTKDLVQQWHKQLYVKNHSTLQNDQNTDFNALFERIHTIQDTWIHQLDTLSSRLNQQQPVSFSAELEDLTLVFHTMITEEKANLMHVQLSLEDISTREKQLSEILTHTPPLMVLNTLQRPLENILYQLQILEELIQKKGIFLEGCISLLVKLPLHKEVSKKSDAIAGSLKQLIRDYQRQCSQIERLKYETQQSLSVFTQQLHGYLSQRQDLPGFDRRAWLTLLEKLTEIPKLFLQRALDTWQVVQDKASHAHWWRSAFTLILNLASFRVLFFIRKRLRFRYLQISDSKERIASAGFLGLFLQLIHRHIYAFIGIFNIWSSLLIWNVPSLAFSWFINLIWVLVIFSIMMQMTRFWLVEIASAEEQQRNVILYHRLRGFLSIGAVTSLLSLIAHQVVLDYEIRNFVARFFMLFLLFTSLTLFKIWTLVPSLLEGYWIKRPKYFKQVVRWVSFLLPMSLLLNAILGLIGYVQLAWAITGYQGLLLCTLAIYPLIQGLLNEVFNWLIEQSIRRFRNGWLWSEALLKPLYQLLKFVILFFIVMFLLRFSNGREQLLSISTQPALWLNRSLLFLNDVNITPLKLIQLSAMCAIVVWSARWTREFAYRWLFSNLKDLGLRNSLSILMQYIAISLSVLATLQIIGVTLSVLKYVLSGFAIGLSFGLRDLFNNFVTGILLLVERPLKVGDWVTIGDCNGQVIHIGARSVTMNTEDHRELMVPNADLFYKQFINWTRKDSIVGFKLPISTKRIENPLKIREVILKVISEMPKILTNPAPAVHFKASNQSLLDFEIEYHVDLNQITSHSDVQSQFLLALWKRFTEEKITLPESIQNVSVSGQLALNQATLKNTTQGFV